MLMFVGVRFIAIQRKIVSVLMVFIMCMGMSMAHRSMNMKVAVFLCQM